MLKENNIYARKYFYPVTSDQACFKNKYRDVDIRNARMLAKEILVLPLYDDLSEEAQNRIIKVVKEFSNK